jgi:hypoxanthine phosphoribosyltransferase
MNNAIRGEYLAVRDGAECLYPSPVVTAAVERVAAAMTVELEDADPLFLCVMVGGFRFGSDLLGHLEFPLEVDYLQVSRYRDQTRGGELDWLHHPASSLRGRSVVVVDDILDEGITLDAVVRHCREEGAASVSTAVLVDKAVANRPIEADWAALDAPDRYLFGEGMDYKGYGRNLRGIWALQEC